MGNGSSITGWCSDEASAQGCEPQQSPAFHLVYVERQHKGISAGECSTMDGASVVSRLSSATSARGISVLKTAGLGIVAMAPDKLDKQKLAEFRELLHSHQIDTSAWGVNGAKSVEHLFWEAYEQRGCMLTSAGQGGTLKRVTRLVKIKLVSEIFGVDHALVSRMQFMHDGQSIERRQFPLRRLNWLSNGRHVETCVESSYAEDCPHTEDWKTGCRLALQDRLGLTERWQEQHLREEPHAYRYLTEDNVNSGGYPGLNTLYCIYEVTFRVLDPEQAQCIGLPQGQEFATTEGDFNFNSQHDEHGLPIGTQLNIWMWERDHPLMARASKPVEAMPDARPAPQAQEHDMRLIKRVPLPELSAHALKGMHACVSATERRPPNSALVAALEGQKTNWAGARKIAKSILDPKYSLAQFNKDLGCFPELNLYLLERKGDKGAQTVSSGRTVGDEYQRTVGAFFAIYWLMRITGDGTRGFSFGVDDSWRPIQPSKLAEQSADKRLTFYRQGRWEYFRRLFFDAGLLEEGRWGSVRVHEKRLLSLLALTAMHDIMKIDLLLPEVQPEHAPYRGYSARDTIADHDLALAYVMDHFPQFLPSFRDLDASERRSVQFTQCNLCFNHGWFVQAEAPPGAVFTKFRECLIRDHKLQISSRDVALYFVHWLTDLAGAEPTPLGGCEKFAVKFPLPVLNSFLRSFEFVEKIANCTETEVMEEYLKVRWAEHCPALGPLPLGNSAVARMRIVCMAQMAAAPVLRGFSELAEEDQEVLSTEMARTGCVGQSYSADLAPREVRLHPSGPAFLVYYGPAFLQNLGTDSAGCKLGVLAEVYRCARTLWPLSIAKVASSVIIRIDTIKALSISDLRDVGAKGDMWLMVKHNENEAFIERSSKRKLNKFIANGHSIQILDLACINAEAYRLPQRTSCKGHSATL
mmetsp:Transcript_84601/g.274071  ORF Transcript_84601/g.274071 Transcript_84601/m.274071 type:complete len:922 (-) Transcript_84601:359-3124(-)